MIRTLMIAAMVVLVGATAPAAAAPKVGQAAPPLTATTLDGASFDLARLRGHVVVVNLWATWCPPCRAEMPALDTVYRARHGQGLEMIGLSADKPRDAAKVRSVMAAFAYPAALASQTHLAGLDPPAALPATFVFDKAGTLRAILAGGPPLTEGRLEAAIAPLLAE